MTSYQHQPLLTQQNPDTIRSLEYIPHWREGRRASYQYQPLPTQQDPNTIRLLELLPGEPSAPLKCKLIQASLTQSPDYEAISYRWGGDDTWIRVDDSYQLKIKDNLYGALYYLRRASQSRILWADAICINQGNNEEKGSQVQLMRKIYQKACRTVIWLGDDPDAGAGLTLLREAARRRESPNRPLLLSTFSPLGLRPDQIFDVGVIFSSPYFERVWVIQEVAVSSKVEVMCELGSASWDDLVSVSKACYRTSLMFHRGLQNVQSLAEARERFGHNAHLSLLFLLSIYRSFCATESKDKVYALLGLVEPTSLEKTGIVPNYNLSNKDAYISVARSLLSTSEDLDLLSHSSRSGPGELQLPSWVPDWTEAAVASPFIDFSNRVEADDRLEVTQTFSATKHSKSKPTFQSVLDLQSVCLRGYVVDRVDAVGITAQPIKEYNFSYFSQNGNLFGIISYIVSSPFKMIQQRCNTSWALIGWEKITGARTRKPYVTGEDMLDVYWKTLVGYLPREDLDIWAKEKNEMEHSTSQHRYLCYLHLHHSFVTWAVSIWVFTPITMILTLFGLIPAYMPFKIDYYIHRKMFNTQDGYVGLGPKDLQPGDQVALFEGGKLPFIIRHNDLGYRLIGECYIHGIMSGERYDPAKCGDFWII